MGREVVGGFGGLEKGQQRGNKGKDESKERGS